MAQNQAVLVTYLKDILFSEEEITQSVEREHIFEMKDKDETSLGFISVYDLKAYVFEHEDEAGDYIVRNIDSSEWTPVFSHPYFQRRKPQLVSMSSLNGHDDGLQFYILKNGQKAGPFEKFELIAMLEEKEVLLTDMVSSNAGHTWMKLFQVENFDRRVLKESDQLPGVPNQAVMGPTDTVNTNMPATEAISSLAYLSNVKRGKSVERDKVETYRAETAAQSSSSIYKWLLVGSIVGIGYFGFHIKNQLNSPFKEESAKVGEQAEMLTPVEMTGGTPKQVTPIQAQPRSVVGEQRNFNQINDTRRSEKKFEQRIMQPIKPVQKKSFMDTSKYQDTRNERPAPAEKDDPNYFYDNTSAMELDPVRAQVSKENFDNSAAEGDGPIPSSDNLFENEVPNNQN